MKSKTAILCILDGWGVRSLKHLDNPIVEATHWNRMTQIYPFTLLEASGQAVGLPENQMGNSEVGHMTIGLGRVVEQSLLRLEKALTTFRTHSWMDAFLDKSKTLHIAGLFSSGGVHSHEDHLFKILRDLKDASIFINLHLFLDGRDTSPKFALKSLEKLKPFLSPYVRIATISGRYYAMDRDNHWDRTTKAYEALIHGKSPYTFQDAEDYIQTLYDQGLSDEFIPPACWVDYGGMSPEDAFLLTNFRSDRVRQLLLMIFDPDFGEVKRSSFIFPKMALGFASYGAAYDVWIEALLPTVSTSLGLGEIVAMKGKRQLRIAETEKYAHVTFFFNGGRETPYPLEDRFLVPSPRVDTYDLKPEMSASQITDHVLRILEKGGHSLIVMNYANPDMVGHTGSLSAAIQAVKTIDECLKRLETYALANEVDLFITSDHGNVECMEGEGGQPHTAHTCSPVPFLVITSRKGHLSSEGGTLADVAPTLLDFLGYDIPSVMTGHSLWEGV